MLNTPKVSAVIGSIAVEILDSRPGYIYCKLIIIIIIIIILVIIILILIIIVIIIIIFCFVFRVLQLLVSFLLDCLKR